MTPSGQRRRRTDEVLLALLGGPADGHLLLERLAASGVAGTAADLLPMLLQLEERGHVHVERDGGYRFSLTAIGQAAADHAGAGSVSATTLVMADLVGFVAYTEREGDERAQRTAQRLADAAAVRFGHGGGRVVKLLGDGVLATVAPDADPLVALRGLSSDLADHEGPAWQLRAAAHRGAPIHHRGDLFGRDVNLVARLCEQAAPGEAVLTDPGGDGGLGGGEVLALRGFDQPISIWRVAL